MDSNIHLPKLTCLFSFIQHFDEGMGWVVKLPYVTNERPFRCTSLEEIIDAIETVSDRVSSAPDEVQFRIQGGVL